MKKIRFLFGIHNHQPVGNFPEVLEKGFEICYRPFIEVMARHPKIKWSLHCTGILWDFFADKHPEYFEAVRKMVKSGQLELVTGGYYEPIMQAIPDRDKAGQIKKLSFFLKKEFGTRPRGMWIAERIWEPHLAKPLAEAGVEYVVLDDTHFAAAGLDPEKLRGYYITEEQGVKLKIFPISQLLRYSIPFHTVDKNLEYFGSWAQENGAPAVSMFDDGEKFGMWPETNKHCYKDRWLENFIEALERNSEWLETMTYSEYLDSFGPEGRIYLPTASYFEMSEWSLPASTQLEFERVVKRFAHEPNILKFLRGGFWRGFLAKYPESNNMHKKMLHVSEKVHKSGDKKAADALYAGQCNCAYWHGVFGGLYLPHLRNGVYNSLIEADAQLGGAGTWEKKDFDCDGKDEILYEGKDQNLYFAPGSGGSLFEWDMIPFRFNMLNVLTRRYEAYHQRLIEYLKNPQEYSSQVKTIHDIVTVKEQGLDKYLHYDWYRRSSLLDHFLHPQTGYEGFALCNYGEQGDFVLGEYSASERDGKLTLSRQGSVWIGDKSFRIDVAKEITPHEGGFKAVYTLTNREKQPAPVVFAPEFNFAFSKFPETGDRIRKNVSEWGHFDAPFGIETGLKLDRQAEFWLFPLETVSLSEYGFERTYQGTVAAPVIRLELGPGKPEKITIEAYFRRKGP